MENKDYIPNLDWPNSLDSNFLKPDTYTLNTDIFQEDLEKNRANNDDKDNCPNSNSRIPSTYTLNRDDKTSPPENDYDKELNPENIIVDGILKNWSLF